MSLPLAELYAALRADGFAIGVDDHVRIGRLLASDTGWTLDKLRHAIAALVITAPDEQAAFDLCWERWLHSAAQPVSPPPDPPPRRRRWRRRVIVELAVLVLVGSGALVSRLGEDRSVGRTQTIWTTETLPVTPATASCPAPSPPQVPSDVPIIAAYAAAGLGAAGLLAAVLAATLAARARRRFLPGPWRYALAVPATTRAVLPQRAIEDAAADLTGLVHERGDELDVPRSVEATAALGGLPALRYRSPLVAARYLVLEDAAGGAERWRFLYDELVRGLAREGVEIERAAFAGGLERCTTADGRSASLDELIDHADAVIAIGDGDAAVDPLTGARAPWLATLRQIPERLWVNPLPLARWSAGALAIADDTPMAHGVAAALAALHGAPRRAADRADRAYPAVIERAPGTGSAVDGLRVALGPSGFALVSAVAIAGLPTLATARWLADAHGFALDERDWLAIATLPWFRTQQWPDGLRDRLRDALAADDPPRARAIADAAARLAAASEPPRASGAHLAWQLDLATRAAQRGDRAAAARSLSRIARTPLAPHARSALATLRLRDRGRQAMRWSIFIAAILLVGGTSFALATSRRRGHAAEARLVERHLLKLTGDGARVVVTQTDAPELLLPTFAVCVVDGNGDPVPGAHLAWSQPKLGPRSVTVTTDPTGVSSIGPLYPTAQRDDLEQVAQYLASYGGTDQGPTIREIRITSDGERVVFSYAAVAPNTAPAASSAAVNLVDLGKLVYEKNGCKACHTVDGTPRVGPSWKGTFGTVVPLNDGTQVRMDENYIRESLLFPQAKVRRGYVPAMPSFEGQLSEREIEGIIAYIKSLRQTNGGAPAVPPVLQVSQSPALEAAARALEPRDAGPDAAPADAFAVRKKLKGAPIMIRLVEERVLLDNKPLEGGFSRLDKQLRKSVGRYRDDTLAIGDQGVDGSLHVTVDLTTTSGDPRSAVTCKLTIELRAEPGAHVLAIANGGATVTSSDKPSADDATLASYDCMEAVVEDLMSKHVIPTIVDQFRP